MLCVYFNLLSFDSFKPIYSLSFMASPLSLKHKCVNCLLLQIALSMRCSMILLCVVCVYRKSFFLTQLRCYSDRLFPLPLPSVCYCYFIGRLRFLIFLSLDIIFNPVDVCGIEINKTSIKIVHMKNEWPAICSLASFCVVSNKQTNKTLGKKKRRRKSKSSPFINDIYCAHFVLYCLSKHSQVQCMWCSLPVLASKKCDDCSFVRLFAYYKCTAVCNSD